ncbi:hypothetical protein [Stygiolobus caldivivus]|uniref:Uncharacterized protein n=1 Tax=Stygiolobus caldivivus TaxID=2824673 RepID=A0A8D5U732_9CREN|nr:hypothetical protein [Stygiolobus caldivivus]BCU70014.1 hypothetical protein KN1_13110 [Stygiolobus caldivivus]
MAKPNLSLNPQKGLKGTWVNVLGKIKCKKLKPQNVLKDIPLVIVFALQIRLLIKGVEKQRWEVLKKFDQIKD